MMHDFIRSQVAAGAELALALVHVHRPDIDLDTVTRGVPVRVNMRDQYVSVARAASRVAIFLEKESRIEHALVREVKKEMGGL